MTQLRYAILFSGMSARRHVNGLELCYRTLVDILGFEATNIHVMNYDGSLRAFGDPADGPVGLWPGDGTPYRMEVNAEGSSSAFREALVAVGRKLGPDDQLFINTSGHGGDHGNGRGPDLITYPDCARYRCRDFCNDLATLPPHASLVVLMAQCFSGGFNREVINASPAAATFIASASSPLQPSFVALEDESWDAFQRDWLTGLGRDGMSVGKAFAYASTCPARSPYDSPEYLAHPQAAVELTLR